LISFETDSELIPIESQAFWGCSSLKSITIPRNVQIICSECFLDAFHFHHFHLKQIPS
jgi:hypothetical protein